MIRRVAMERATKHFTTKKTGIRNFFKPIYRSIKYLPFSNTLYEFPYYTLQIPRVFITHHPISLSDKYWSNSLGDNTPIF